uniref:Uncharacterized protein n=1 Tax=Arundo donax TaxID=35708 RepID=A0A0A8XMZ2_ARUDO
MEQHSFSYLTIFTETGDLFYLYENYTTILPHRIFFLLELLEGDYKYLVP